MKTRQLFISFVLGLGLTLTLLWLLGGVTLHAAYGGVITVCLSGGCDYTSIQEAVDAAVLSDEIRVAAGTYTGVQGRPAPVGYDGPSVITQVVYIAKNVTIRGGYNADFSAWDPHIYYTTLDAQGQGRVFYITGDIKPTIEGLRITGGDADGLGGGYLHTDAGGGLYLYYSDATFSGNTVISNTVHDKGGGLYLHYSDAALSGNTVISNTAHDRGGGLYLYHSYATLSGNTVISNTAYDRGGGLYLYSSSDATLSSNDITANTAITGGGLYLSSSPATLSGNTVISNHAHDNGGGLYLSSSAARLSGNTVTANHADDNGGGLYLSCSAAKLSGNTVTANTADDGGGLYLSSSDPTLSFNDITANTAYDKGGGLYLSSSDPTLSFNDITANIAITSGGGLYLYTSAATLSRNTVILNTAHDKGGGLYLSSSDPTLSFNDITANTAHDKGGGLYLYASDAMLSGNTVISNTAEDKCGGLRLYSSDATLANNVVADNWARNAGSGLCITCSFPRLLHTTIARNSGGDGRGVYVTNEGSSYSTVTLTNTILVSHAVGINVTAGNTATLECTLWGTGAWANDTDWGGAGTIITGTRNYWGDPAFVDPDAGDYHIGLGSAAIDAGVDAGVNDDIDGDLRPMGGCDIGADELPKIFLPIAMQGYCTDNYEPNDSCNQAYGPLTSGQTYQSWITQCDLARHRTDYFYIDIGTTNAINIYLTNIPFDTDYDLYLYKHPCDDPVNPVDESVGVGISETISYPPPASGRYYIRVYSYSGHSASPYSLRVTYD